MLDAHSHIQLLKLAELQFRLSCIVRTATNFEELPLNVPLVWTYGKHVIQSAEFALTPDEAAYAGDSLYHAATFLMVVQIRNAIAETVPDAKNHHDANICSAYQIARLIRNAFAHQPFNPTWSIDADCLNTTFTVHGIMEFDTTNLQSKPFNWMDYGGPLAILRLSQFVRSHILKEGA